MTAHKTTIALALLLAGCASTNISEQCNDSGICVTVYQNAKGGMLNPVSVFATLTHEDEPTKILGYASSSQSAPMIKLLGAAIGATGLIVGAKLVSDGLDAVDLNIGY